METALCSAAVGTDVVKEDDKIHNNVAYNEDVICFWCWTNERKMANETFIAFTDSLPENPRCH